MKEELRRVVIEATPFLPDDWYCIPRVLFCVGLFIALWGILFP